MVGGDSVPPCRHQEMVRRLSIVLFPAEMDRRLSSKSKRRDDAAAPLFPRDIVNAVASIVSTDVEQEQRQARNLFGEQIVNLILIDDDDSGGGGRFSASDGCILMQEDNLRIADELRHALRALLVNQRASHSADEEWTMNHFECKRRKLPHSSTVRFSKRYWHHATYWLCEILTLICVKFVVRLKKSSNNDDEHFAKIDEETAISLLSRHVTNREELLVRRVIRTQSCLLRWKLAVFRKRMISPRCRQCVNSMLRDLCCHTVRNAPSRYDAIATSFRAAVVTIVLSCEFLRTYRRMMQRTNGLCAKHEPDYFYSDSTPQFTLSLIMDELYDASSVFKDRLAKNEYTPKPVLVDEPAECIRAIARFTFRLACNSPWNNSSGGTIQLGLDKNFFNLSHWFHSVILPLLGEPLRIELTYRSFAAMFYNL